jgi:N-hydroxyarylamine O-acetyltransferase
VNVRDYLDRIQVDHVPEPTLAGLEKLHEQHLMNAPFENLDIHRGVPIVLDLEKILEKIVTRRRGGFCYELNAAFAWLLTELGYDVTMLSAEVARPDGTFGIPFDHMTLGVEIDGAPWLADVGFGEGFLRPIPLDDRASGDYHLAREEDVWFLLHGKTVKYRFTLAPRKLHEYEAACTYQQTSDESTFTQRVFVTRATPDGRVTLTRERLIRSRGRGKSQSSIVDAAAWRNALETHFGIVLES